MSKITEKMANSAYDILVKECGAPDREDDRRSFVSYAISDHAYEYRFSGLLGFGGKCYFRRERGSQTMTVGMYIEDSTPERVSMQIRANGALARLDDTTNV